MNIKFEQMNYELLLNHKQQRENFISICEMAGMQELEANEIATKKQELAQIEIILKKNQK